MKIQESLGLTTFHQPTNHQQWLTFSMEETMKQLDNQTNQSITKAIVVKKARLFLVVILVVLFSACSQ